MKMSKLMQGIAPLAVGALFSSIPVGAQPTPFTATGWVNGVPAPGILCTNALGQVLLRGLVHSARIESTDARVTGQLLILGDASYSTNGTAISQGTAYLQVGTWDLAKTNFTPTGGMWETRYRGLMQTDNSFQLSIAGYGSGGTIDGLRSEATLTRAAAPGPIDFTVPYAYTGTITPPPASTVLDSDDFSGGVQDWTSGSGSGTVTLEGTNALTLQAHFTRASGSSTTTCAWAMRDRAWTVNDGQTLELRVDLVRLNEAASEALLAIFRQFGGPGYTMTIGRDYVTINKYMSGLAVLCGDKVTLRSTNLACVLALTGAGENLLLTARVQDRDRQDVVLYERTVLDSPGVDPTLSDAELRAVCGVGLTDLRSDSDGPPWTTGGSVWLGLWQETDGTRPPAEATFDNFELRLNDVPLLSPARAARLTWPASSGVNYSVEGAPTVRGPWLPVQDLAIPGLQQMTVPASDVMGYFRLRRAP